MRFPQSILTLAGLAAVAAALPLSATAAASYGNIASPGVYYGSGNVNGNWTIDTSNNVEVALRIKDRASNATIDGSSGIYQANAGFCNPICAGGPKANWNYDFSVNTQAGGGTLDLSNVFVLIELDQDASAATSFTTLDVLTNWGDNTYWNGTTGTVQAAASAGDFGVQQSANPLFGNSGYGYLPGSGLYDLRLSVYAKDTNGGLGALLAQTTAEVSVPEPGSLVLVGLAGLLAVGTLRKPAAKQAA